MLSIHKEALKRKPKLIRYYQPGVRGFEDFLASQTEHNFRVRDRAAPAAAPAISKPARIQNQPETQIPRIPAPHRDWHKFGGLRVTVSNQHLSGQDDELESDYAHLIMDGYAEAVALVTAMQAAFPLVNPNLIRCLLEVHGGVYKERCVFDNPYVDVYGIGFPTIWNDLPSSPGGVPSPGIPLNLTSIVTIAAAATQCTFDGFRIINPVLVEGFRWWDGLGLTVEEGNEVGKATSSIELRNLKLLGGGTQAYIHRRALGINVVAESIDNYSNSFTDGEASVIERYGFTEDIEFLIGPQPNPRRGWSKWIGCEFSGEMFSDFGSMSPVPDNYKRGKSFKACALESDFLTWVDNFSSMGGGIYNTSPTSDHFLLRTGVYHHDCDFNGWTENIGWAMEFDSCKNLQGRFNNDTGAGATHHLMKSNTDAFANAFTWFTGGTEADVNYLIEFSDVNQVAPGASCHAWLRNMVQASPSFGAGGTVMNPAGAAPLGHCYAVQSSTHLQFFLNGPIAGLDYGILTNCSNRAANSISNTVGIQNIQMRQGFQNFVLP